jgi:predicted house-cleaning noncanonical NTP pyrophosphatase (MazG superfamily)
MVKSSHKLLRKSLTGFGGARSFGMQPVFYDQAIHQPTRFSGVAENDPPPYGAKSPKKDDDEDEFLYGTEETLYEEVLQLLEDKYLEERFAMCLEIREGDRVIYAFPKIACPELFIERLKINARKL